MKSNDLIYLPGGATPRPKDRPDLLLTTKLPPKIKSSQKLKELVKKFEYTGKLDLQDFNSAQEIGQFIDFYNNTVLNAKQNEFQKEITARNEYYWKLWIRAMEETR